MSIPDYLEVIKADGGKVMFRGFVTKKKEKYDAELIFHDEQIKFAYELEKIK